MTDRGAQFVSRDFHAMMEDWGIRHSMSRPRTPVDNGWCGNPFSLGSHYGGAKTLIRHGEAVPPSLKGRQGLRIATSAVGLLAMTSKA